MPKPHRPLRDRVAGGAAPGIDRAPAVELQRASRDWLLARCGEPDIAKAAVEKPDPRTLPTRAVDYM